MPSSKRAHCAPETSPEAGSTRSPPVKRKPGAKPKAVVDRSAALWTAWEEPKDFAGALAMHMARFGDTPHHLARVFHDHPDGPDKTTLRVWTTGVKQPSTDASFRILAAIEHRYQLPDGYFRAKLPRSGKAARVGGLEGVRSAERRRLAWHLPENFARRPVREREEILTWVRGVILTGATDYRSYHAEALQHRFGLQFPACAKPGRPPRRDGAGPLTAPARLAGEMASLQRFKTQVLTEAGYERSGVWGPETAAQKAEHLGLLFGALIAPPDGPIRGLGLPPHKLTLGLLVLPAAWDWYLAWREQRRGFFTAWERDMLLLAAALTRRETGWLRQTPDLGQNLQAIPGLVSEADIAKLQTDWAAACDEAHRHALARSKEIDRVSRVHRDPFEPILPILEAESPLAEYRKIADEILRRMPDARRYPKAAAEAARGFLMLRLGLHLGVRQKNLRELLICQRGETPTLERRLETVKRGEMRWSERDTAWEVLIPATAFKNAGSSYFAGKPFRLLLPDLADLYPMIDLYLAQHRPRLLGGAQDPQTFFVKSTKISSRDAAFSQTTFCEAWRLTIQRYGIFNPYTGRGAIKGLLPHGPHNVRDVLATHILKQTGSYEQASYAIQDTVETVAKHYGRFLPQDKAALAAQVLNRTWGSDPDQPG